MIPSIVLSVKTKFADLIIDGEKTCELRKRPLSADKVHAFIYSSGKTKKIVGSCLLEISEYHSYMVSKGISLFTCEYSYPTFARLCISETYASDYLSDDSPYVYEISNVVKFPEPLDLVHFGLTHAPQSWAYARCIPASLMGVSP